VCNLCATKLVISSAAQLEDKTGQQIADLHSHFIDNLEFACESCSGVMRRIPEVFDCWFESGSMPVAQVHYPFENQEYFNSSFPADFIAEGLDQTRGWFYTLLVISTALFDQMPFKNCVVNGMVLAADGSKMSKSKKNYPDPEFVINEYGSDALRAYLVGSPVVRGEPLQFNEVGVKEVVRSVLLPLYNSWSFFVQYANIDNFNPATDLSDSPKLKDRAEIDRWILSKLQTLIKNINVEMNGYYLYKIIPPMLSFIDDLTNWYIRRSRRRFWKDALSSIEKDDKLAAYATLYEVLTTFARVIAPLMPFMSETLYQNLVLDANMQKPGEDSVHLCDFPEADQSKIDSKLEQAVELTRLVVTMGRALREKHRLKTRQPLKKITVVCTNNLDQQALLNHADLITSELNIRELELLDSAETLCDLSSKPNFKTLGPRVGKDMGAIGKAIEALTLTQIAKLEAGNTILINTHEISLADIVINRQAKGDFVVMSEGDITVALDTELDADLKDEGLMREAVSLLQRLRKTSGLEVTDRIKLELFSNDEEILRALKHHEVYVKAELLACELLLISNEDAPTQAVDIQIEDKGIEVVLSKI
jgi:isoleucyl-tRNA synthetase